VRGAEKPPQEIALAVPGKRTPLSKTRDFLGTPAPPQEIALAVFGERPPVSKTRNFLGPRLAARAGR
jgi:hypothetical protein